MSASLAERTAALAEVADLAEGRFAAEFIEASRALVAKAGDRLRHGSDHTVIALVGPTGSGKSSLFNALAGTEVSTPGVRRPTTSQTHAVSWGSDATPLLDWLAIPRRHHLPDADGLNGLVLLDLPDFDSTEAANRMEVDRLIQLVDLLVWIVEPQKYADQSLHAGYVRPLAGHHDVMAFALSKIDTLDAEQAAAASQDFVELLRHDGIPEPTVLGISSVTGQGVDALRALVSAAVDERAAMAARLDADLRAASEQFGSSDAPDVAIASRLRKPLVAGLGRAAGVDEAAAVVAHRHRRDAAAVTGWPPLRWARGLRRNKPPRLPSPTRSPVAQAEVGAVLRDAGDSVAAELSPPWSRTVRTAAIEQREPVQQALERVNARAIGGRGDTPRWWSAAAWLQRLFGLIAAAGAAWLLALAVVGGLLRLDVDPLTPQLGDWMPIPTALLLTGLAFGFVVTVASRAFAKVGGKRAGRRATKQVNDELDALVGEQVIIPMQKVLDDRRELLDRLRVVAGR